MKGFSRLLVVAVSAVTLVLMGAVGASAATKTLGTPKAVTSVVTLVSGHSKCTDSRHYNEDHAHRQ